MRLFLDDIREPSHCLSYMHLRIGQGHTVYAQEWKVVRDFLEFEEAVIKHHSEIRMVSFDHDLSIEHYNHALMEDPAKLKKFYKREDREKTGFDCAQWMKDFYCSRGLTLPEIIVHSMNPAGTVNIEEVFFPTDLQIRPAEPKA